LRDLQCMGSVSVIAELYADMVISYSFGQVAVRLTGLPLVGYWRTFQTHALVLKQVQLSQRQWLQNRIVHRQHLRL